jgi:Mrp family chromosome partitioning ATPase
VSKYYDAINRNLATTREPLPPVRPRAKLVSKTRELIEQPAREVTPRTEEIAFENTLLPEPLPYDLPAMLARQDAISQLSERMAPTAAVDKSCRVAITGCRPSDGASSIAAALALDLSQRLSMRTILVDANLQSPSLHRVVSPAERTGTVAQITLDGSLQLRTTGWQRLTLATCCLNGNDDEREAAIAELEAVLSTFPAVVIDLGVARLDPRMLPLMRPADPILLVVRYGQTERKELATTAAALRAADRTVAGVILNARPTRSRNSSAEYPPNE